MFFPGIGNVRVRWYFTDKPFLKVPTVYNSRNWLSDKKVEFPAGERKRASRPWADGSGPGDLACDGPQGTPEAFAGKPGPPLFPHKGFPRRKEASWDQASSWSAFVQWLGHYASSWDQASSWSVRVQWAGHYASSWDQASSWSAVQETLDHFAASWDQASSWSADVRTHAAYASSWDQASSWSAVKQTPVSYAASWDQASSWDVWLTTAAHYAASWDQASSWSAVATGVDNVIAFACGTLVATGTTQGTAAAIAADSVLMTSTAINQGVILPAACNRVLAMNNNSGGTSYPINVYPPTGAKINALATNSPQSLTAGQKAYFMEVSATQWVMLGPF